MRSVQAATYRRITSPPLSRSAAGHCPVLSGPPTLRKDMNARALLMSDHGQFGPGGRSGYAPIPGRRDRFVRRGVRTPVRGGRR